MDDLHAAIIIILSRVDEVAKTDDLNQIKSLHNELVELEVRLVSFANLMSHMDYTANMREQFLNGNPL